MPKLTETTDSRPFIVTNTPTVLVIIGIILFAIFGELWWSRIYNSPRRVFEGMLRNNLSTLSVTRTSTSSAQKGFERIEQLNFSPPIATRTYIKLVQPSQSGQATVETETIGTQSSDYSKYLKINVGDKASNPPAYKAIEGLWGRSSLSDGEPQYLSQAMQGLVPFANLSAADRTRVVNLINSKGVYKVNYASTKPKKINGKSAIDFSVSVNPAKYIEMLKEIGKSVGLNGFATLDAEQYKDQPNVNISIVVDKLSRQVIEVDYGQQKEAYSAYGINRAVELPEKTIPFSDLQQKIQAVQ